MQATICKMDYDTDASEIIEKFTYGFYGDPKGYEETLYVTEKGHYFIYTCGGEESPYPTESIKRIAKSKIDDWIAQHKS